MSYRVKPSHRALSVTENLNDGDKVLDVLSHVAADLYTRLQEAATGVR